MALVNQPAKVLSPFVYWGQTDSTVSLKVDLKCVQNPQIDLKPDLLTFFGHGYGAKGNSDYTVGIEFLDLIEPHDSFYKVNEREIEFILKKRSKRIWPCLLKNAVKPAWLKVDFDKMHDDDSEIDEEEAKEWQKTTQNSFRDVGKKNFGRRKKQELKPEEFRKVYLFLFNLFQLVGFSYVFFILSIRYFVEGPNSMEGSYHIIGGVMKFVHVLQILEVLHPFFGFTRGSWLFPFLQVCYRLFILTAMLDGEPRMQTKPVVFYLFFTWTIAEMLRYPYYMLRVFDVNVGFLTWLNYTAWIGLFPMSFICEGVIFLRNVPYFDETQNYSIALPNWYNFAFSMPIFIRLYLLVGLFPIFCMKMTRMYRKRIIAVGPKSWKKAYEKED